MKTPKNFDDAFDKAEYFCGILRSHFDTFGQAETAVAIRGAFAIIDHKHKLSITSNLVKKRVDFSQELPRWDYANGQDFDDYIRMVSALLTVNLMNHTKAKKAIKTRGHDNVVAATKKALATRWHKKGRTL